MEGSFKLVLLFVCLQYCWGVAMGSFACGIETSINVSFRQVNYLPIDNCGDFTREYTAPTGMNLTVLFVEIGPSTNCTVSVGNIFQVFKQGDYLMLDIGPFLRVRCQPVGSDNVRMQFVAHNPNNCPLQSTISIDAGASVTIGNYNTTQNYADSLACSWHIVASNQSDNCNFTFVNTGAQSLPAGDYVTVADRATKKGFLNPLTGVHTMQSNEIYISFMSNNDGTANNGFRFIVTRCGQLVTPIVAATQAPTVTTPVLPPIVCSISPSFNLSSDMLRMLNASSTDQLIISPTYVEDISTVSPKCKALGSQPTFHFNLTDCPAVYKSNGTHMSVTYVIRNKAGFNRPSVVQRFKDIAMNITCDFKTQEMINFAQIIPEIQKIQVFQTSVSGRFDIDFGFYNSPNFSVKLAAGSTVSVPNPVYARIGLANIPSNVRNLIVQTKRCWATNTIHPNSTKNYNLISQSCPADSYTTVTRNHNSSYTTFEFKSFIWTNVTLSSQQIYVHCEVTICDQNLNATCNTLNCAPSRRRRDASTNPYKIISAGPVLIATSIDDDTRPCEQNDYCSDVCTMMGGKPVCSCGEGLELGEDMRTCVELPNEDSNTLVYLMGISLVLLLGIIAMKKFNA